MKLQEKGRAATAIADTGGLTDQQYSKPESRQHQELPCAHLDAILKNAPKVLRILRQWVAWKVVERNGNPTKLPINPANGDPASSTDPATWSSFDEAVAACRRCDGLAGVGFVFTAADPYCGIDLDDCRDPETGAIAPWGQAIIDEIASYAEISPSGTGVKMFVQARKLENRCRTRIEDGEIEIYDKGRFFVVTGQHISTTPTTVESRQAQLDVLYARVFPERKSPNKTADRESHARSPNPYAPPEDDSVIQILENANNGKRFKSLWEGKWPEAGHKSQSEADLSLVGSLVFVVGNDPARIDRLFRQSGLFREKWDREDYRDSTIRKALEGVKSFYRPKKVNTSTPASQAECDAVEIDCSIMIRPELFHTPDVSGIAIPIRSIVGSEAVTRWGLYLRFANGRREKRDLDSFLDLPDGRRLWVHPIPGKPSPTIQAGWSMESRRTWLAGNDTPNPCDVFKRICNLLDYYIDFAPDVAAGSTATLALWTMLTYGYPAWQAVPYLSIGGPLGSGKSTVFRVLARLAFRALQSSNMTAPCLFRTLHEQGGTLLLDEAERLRDGSPEASDLRSVLLSGYQRGSPAMRLERVGDNYKQVAFDVFGPKAVASIANPPEALASRCIRIVMFRNGPDSLKPRRRIDAEPEKWQSLRDDLHALALDYGPTWGKLSAMASVVPGTIGGRDYELWQPILAIASWIDDHGGGGLLTTMQKHAELVVGESREDAIPDADETLIRILAEHVVSGTHRNLKASEILSRAKEVDPTTFDKWSPLGVSRTLSRYGLRTHKSHGSKTYGRVNIAMLAKVASAYGLDFGLPVTTNLTVPQTLDAGVHGAHQGTFSGSLTRA